MINKLESVQKALKEIKRREQERVDKQQSLGKFPIEASVLIIAKEALVELNEVIDRLNSEELVKEVGVAIRGSGVFVTGAREAINIITGKNDDR